MQIILHLHHSDQRPNIMAAVFFVRLRPQSDTRVVNNDIVQEMFVLFFCLQLRMFQRRLSGEPIGFSVLGIFVISKRTILSVSE